MLKTKKEQQNHLNMLIEITQLLNKYNIPALLTNSALLGAYRDGELIAHSLGVVISTFYDEIKPKEKIILSELKQDGFIIQKHFINRNWKIRVGKGRLNVEICGYSDGGDVWYRQLKNKRKVILKKFFMKPFGKIKLSGYEFNCPQDIEGFLNYLYNDWKIKLTSKSTPSKYKSDKHMSMNK